MLQSSRSMANQMRRFRAIAIHYDKTTQNVFGAVHLAAATTWLN